jgi:serine/threonine protein kinase
MKATMSKTYFTEVDGEELFCKLKEASNFDTRTVMFQAKLSEMIDGKFSINKFRGINLKQQGHTTFYEITFDKLKEIAWEPNHDNMRLIGTAMAHLHNFAYYNKNLLTMPVKNETYADMDKWLYISKKDKRVKNAYETRLHIFNSIERLNQSQPKIAVHRDFKLHNVIFDGETYNLIDFDFAAVDFVSIEVMGFIVDVIKFGMEHVETFFKHYNKTIKIPIISKSFVNDYLNYLCTNTFPFYMQDKMSIESVTDLVDYRNKCLDTIYENKDELNKIIQDTSYDSN